MVIYCNKIYLVAKTFCRRLANYIDIVRRFYVPIRITSVEETLPFVVQNDSFFGFRYSCRKHVQGISEYGENMRVTFSGFVSCLRVRKNKKAMLMPDTIELLNFVA